MCECTQNVNLVNFVKEVIIMSYLNIEVEGVKTPSGAHILRVTLGDKISYMRADRFLKNQTEAISELVDDGLFLIGRKRADLLKAAGTIVDFVDEPLLDRVGWNGVYFGYPDGTVFSPPGFEPADAVFEKSPEKCHQAGTLEGWLEKVATPFTGHKVCEFALMMPFAAPLRSLTNRTDNFGFEYVSEPHKGKSTLLQVMSSMHGGALGGEDGDYGLSFAATDNGIETEMVRHSDLLIPIDEADQYQTNLSRTARGKAFTKIMMDLGQGREKLRYKGKSRRFRFAFFITSNEDLNEICHGTSAPVVLAAAAERLMTIPLKGREHGVFDYLPRGYADPADLVADVAQGMADHHGTAMRHYLQELVNARAQDSENFENRLDEHIAEFRKQVYVSNYEKLSRRVADAFGLVFAAGLFAKRCGVLPAEFDPMAAALECYRLHRGAFETEPDAVERLLALVDDPETIDLDRVGIQVIAKGALTKVKAFKRTGKSGNIDLLIPEPSILRIFPNWSQVRRQYPVSRLLKRQQDRWTWKARVRSNRDNDPMVFVMVPSDRNN
jgi:hypothetical protein